MDRIFILMKNYGPTGLSAPATGLNKWPKSIFLQNLKLYVLETLHVA